MQIFKPRANAIFRLLLLSAAGGALCGGSILVGWKWTSYESEVDVPLRQPVPFSHQHHVSGLGLDCRYCHASVERAADAGMPSSKTCMTCHSRIWNEAPMLAPVRDSFARDVPLAWNRVTRLPRYVYFDHSIHVAKGVGCTSCHGQVNEMPLAWKGRSFYMRDCLSCHREPERYLRPPEEVFDPTWQPPADPEAQLAAGRALATRYAIPAERMTDCYTCHR